MVWKQEEVKILFQNAKERINTGVSRDLMCRLANEVPPNETRHLTDTRTRVSTLLEYALGYEANEILREKGGNQWLSCVLWNVFPDLLLRNESGSIEAGVEVKALHTAAEEKSANLSTPLSKIRAAGDYLVIMSWGWERSLKFGTDARYPHVYFVEVFNAHHLARIRDFTWLMNQGNRVKGVDCSTPIISSHDNIREFKAEEGNLGKLMRINLDNPPPPGFPDREHLINEAQRFETFQKKVLGLGLIAVFKEVCFGISGTEIEAQETSGYPKNLEELGKCTLPSGATLSLWAGNRLRSNLDSIPGKNKDVIIWLGVKLAWKIYMRCDGQWVKLEEGKKAESSISTIDDAIRTRALLD